jgi:hypothetical protein
MWWTIKFMNNAYSNFHKILLEVHIDQFRITFDKHVEIHLYDRNLLIFDKHINSFKWYKILNLFKNSLNSTKTTYIEFIAYKKW